MKKQKVVLGMSGGVDSTVAALLLQKQGFEVIGFFMNASQKTSRKWPSSIDWKADEKLLKSICKQLKIKLHILDCEEGYETKVISKMFRDYSKNLTPNPDILCNNVGKFPGLLKLMKKESASWIATGHYARIHHTKKGSHLLTGKDKEKDQSYFLFGLPQKILRKCLFPLGDLTKEQVRSIAKKHSFPNYDKRSSRGICYLGKIDMKSFLRSRITSKQGPVVDPDGNIVGHHPGTMFFTIGERARHKNGFHIHADYNKKTNNAPLFIAGKFKKNTIVIAPKGHPALKTKQVKIKSFKLINKKDFPKTNLKARIRHLGQLLPGKLTKKQNSWTWVFEKPQEGVAPGQTIVLHHKDKLIAGGEIRL
jgi:tRNA-specific 2-thiouridylase